MENQEIDMEHKLLKKEKMLNLIEAKFMNKRIRLTQNHHTYRRGGGPKFAFELIQKFHGELSIKNFILQGGQEKYLCQLIGQGKAVVEEFPNWNDSLGNFSKKKFHFLTFLVQLIFYSITLKKVV